MKIKKAEQNSGRSSVQDSMERPGIQKNSIVKELPSLPHP